VIPFHCYSNGNFFEVKSSLAYNLRSRTTAAVKGAAYDAIVVRVVKIVITTNINDNTVFVISNAVF
jgi:hypothetical protein